MTVIKSRERFDEPVTSQVVTRAMDRGAKRQRGLCATAARYMDDIKSLMISFADGSAVVLPVRNYPELSELEPTDLDRFEVILAGSAVSIATKDLHLSIAGLVRASQPLMDMAATLVAAKNGSSISAAKSLAAKMNGAKGGRPRKATPLAPDES